MNEDDRKIILDSLKRKRKSIKTKAAAILELKRIGYLTPSGRVSSKFSR
jgi:hypothetical protein